MNTKVNVTSTAKPAKKVKPLFVAAVKKSAIQPVLRQGCTT